MLASYIQQQFDGKQQSGDSVTNSTLSATQTELQREFTASAAAYTTANVVVASSAAAVLSTASTSYKLKSL